jgi:type IV pilus biogenesis/stability protein PilW
LVLNKSVLQVEAREENLMRIKRNARRLARWQVHAAVAVVLLLAACGPSSQKSTKEMNRSLAGNRSQLGARYLQDGQLRRALQEYTEAAKLAPRNATYQSNLGQVYFFLEEHELALEHLRKALKINPALTDAHHNLAMVYSEMGDYENAEKEYRIALEDPAYLTPEKVYLNWASTLKKKGDPEGAEAMARKAVALNPRYTRGHRELGRLLEERGDTAGALDSYLKAYRGMPEEPEMNLKLGELYIRQGKPEQAKPFLQKVLDTAPANSSEAIRAQAFLEDLASG